MMRNVPPLTGLAQQGSDVPPDKDGPQVFPLPQDDGPATTGPDQAGVPDDAVPANLSRNDSLRAGETLSGPSGQTSSAPAAAGPAPDAATPSPSDAARDDGLPAGLRPTVPEALDAGAAAETARPVLLAAPGPGTAHEPPASPAKEASARHVAASEAPRQAADAIVRSRDGQVEIAMAPDELGRVRMILGADGQPERLGLLAERPDTLDLFRRHADQLIRDLRENGMPEAQLGFLRSDGGGRQPQGGPAQDRPGRPGSAAGIMPPRTAPRRPSSPQGNRA
ncbi:MAG TPA: flagellar hook-length control protein FliK [Paracoccus sp. (in: a-proteobacteria)]|nr:flagellar hook-length control protein FliK [Paracoccus sp. (in: a-proteobacteria)]